MRRKPKNCLVFTAVKKPAIEQLTYRMPTMYECVRELQRRRKSKACEREMGLGKNVLASVTSGTYTARPGKKNYRAVLTYLLKHHRRSRIWDTLPYGVLDELPNRPKGSFRSLREVLKELKEKNEQIQRKTEGI